MRAACAAAEEAAPRAELIGGLKEFAGDLGFAKTENFRTYAPETRAHYRCYYTDKLKLPQAREIGMNVVGLHKELRSVPLLSNLYMRRFVLGWKQLGHEKRLRAYVVNYADDLVICCRGNAHDALAAMRGIMRKLKLTVNETKTRVWAENGTGLQQGFVPSSLAACPKEAASVAVRQAQSALAAGQAVSGSRPA